MDYGHPILYFSSDVSRRLSERRRYRAVSRELAIQGFLTSPTAKSVASKRLALERFPNGLNRKGFPNQQRSDSSCMLVKEASMHGQSPFG